MIRKTYSCMYDHNYLIYKEDKKTNCDEFKSYNWWEAVFIFNDDDDDDEDARIEK